MLRPRDADALRAELRHVAVEGGVPVLFGGEVHGNALLLSEFVGTRTGLLRGLVVRSNSGLGGASMVAGRPLAVADYRSAATITHDYDTPVLSEGIQPCSRCPWSWTARRGRCSTAPTAPARRSVAAPPT